MNSLPDFLTADWLQKRIRSARIEWRKDEFRKEHLGHDLDTYIAQRLLQWIEREMNKPKGEA